MATPDWEEGDDWELINDDGFVYKRKKRRLDPSASTSAAPHPPPPDPAAEERNRRERKRSALLKLRDKYQREIDRWEHLSNSLKSMQEKAQNHQHRQLQRQGERATTTSSSSAVDLPLPETHSSEASNQRLLDDLLLRVEAEDTIIKDVSNLCDLAEAICDAQEDLMKQSLVDLPIWGSPRELMTSLCDD